MYVEGIFLINFDIKNEMVWDLKKYVKNTFTFIPYY